MCTLILEHFTQISQISVQGDLTMSYQGPSFFREDYLAYTFISLVITGGRKSGQQIKQGGKLEAGAD